MRQRKSKAEAATESRAVIGYARVSTDQQVTDGCSLEVQAERIVAYCTAQGLELVALVREEAVSGGVPLAQREGGRELLRLVVEHGARHIVAFKLDRLFRDAMDALGQTREWDRAGVALHVIDMGGQTINTASAVGRMFLTMTAAFAELERNLISERTSSALRHKASRGEAVSRAPRGLRIVEGRFEADPDSDGLAIYARACALRERGLTYREIADALNTEGYAAERGARIHASVVRRWIHNPSLAFARRGHSDHSVPGSWPLCTRANRGRTMLSCGRERPTPASLQSRHGTA